MKKLIAVGILASQVVACGSQTTYRLRSGYEIEGQPVRRTGNRLRIRTDDGTASVDVCRIADVSHPGEGMAITGTALLGAGVLVGGASFYGWYKINNPDPGRNADTGDNMATGMAVVTAGMFSILSIVVGGALAGGGYANWNESEEKSGPLPATGCADFKEEGYKPYEPPRLRRETGPERRPGVTRLP